MVKEEIRIILYVKRRSKRTEERIIDKLFKTPENPENDEERKASEKVREKLRKQLKSGELDENLIDIYVSGKMPVSTIEIFSGGSFEEIDMSLGGLLNNIFDRKKRREVKVKKAREIILSEEL